MKYEILDSLPNYGPMYVPVTGDDEPYYSQGFAVRFYKDDNSEWVANFKPGWSKLNLVYEFDKQQHFLVIAGGVCYIMSRNDTKAIDVFGDGYESVIVARDGRLILQDTTYITVLEPNGEHWNSETISWDGLKDLKLDGNVITGLSYDPMNKQNEWVGFCYNLDTKVLSGGSYK